MLSKSINTHSVTDSEAGELNTLQPCISHGAAAKWCTFPDSELHHNWLPCEYSHSKTLINLRRGWGIWKHKTPDFSISNPIRLLSLSPSGQVSVQSPLAGLMARGYRFSIYCCALNREVRKFPQKCVHQCEPWGQGVDAESPQVSRGHHYRRLWSGLRIPYRSPLHLVFCARQSAEPGKQFTSLSPQRHHRLQVKRAHEGVWRKSSVHKFSAGCESVLRQAVLELAILPLSFPCAGITFVQPSHPAYIFF